MKKITSITYLIIISMLILSACAIQPAEITPVPPTSTEVTPTPVPPTSTEVVPTDPGQIIVTLDDQGKTLDLAVGESFLLKLGEAYTWNVTISDQTVLSRVKNILVVRGAQGIYNALQVGAATLSASGDPVCRQAKPSCAMPSILFSIIIIVK